MPVALAVLLGLAPRWSLRRALGAALVPVVALAPFARDLILEPQLALGGVGLFDWAGTTPDPWRLALLDVSPPAGEGLPTTVAGLLPYAAAPLLALALVGLLRSRRRLTSLAAILVAAVALAAAIAVSHLVVDTVPIGTTGAGQPIRPWAGALLTVYALVVVALAVRGLDVLARAALVRRWVRPAAPIAGLLAVGALVIASAWSGFGSTLSTFVDDRPAVAVDHADGSLAGRSILIERLGADEGAEAATAYRLLAAEVGLPVRSLPTQVEVSGSLDSFVSRLDVGALDAPGDDLPGGAAAVLSRHAIGFVALTEQLPAEAVRALDAAGGMRRLPDREGLRWWRVDSTTSDVPSPARVVLRGEDGDGIDRWLLALAAAGLLVIAYLALPFGGVTARPEEEA
ncbi:MAG: hypothetical protein LC679_18210 [Intrasporangiaceae bacterium]|nr:hypothetical protein [Intrasporangiaceae bacterium]